MNRERRIKITETLELLSTVIEQVQECLDEEQEYYDNMPDSFKDTEKGQLAEAAINNLEEALNALQEAQGNLEESLN